MCNNYVLQFSFLEKIFRFLVPGFYMTRKPVLILNDADLIMQVMLKEFSLFNDKGFDPDTEFDMILNNLFFVTGSKWKFQRNKFAPAFTTGRCV